MGKCGECGECGECGGEREFMPPSPPSPPTPPTPPTLPACPIPQSLIPIITFRYHIRVPGVQADLVGNLRKSTCAIASR